ncbi:MAG: hypothetical protein ACQESE_03520 [Nanobdellota archaeon]
MVSYDNSNDSNKDYQADESDRFILSESSAGFIRITRYDPELVRKVASRHEKLLKAVGRL